MTEGTTARDLIDSISATYSVAAHPSLKLIGVIQKLEGPAQNTIGAAAKIEAQRAPQREAERQAAEKLEEQSKLEKARQANKPRFKI